MHTHGGHSQSSTIENDKLIDKDGAQNVSKTTKRFFCSVVEDAEHLLQTGFQRDKTQHPVLAAKMQKQIPDLQILSHSRSEANAEHTRVKSHSCQIEQHIKAGGEQRAGHDPFTPAVHRDCGGENARHNEAWQADPHAAQILRGRSGQGRALSRGAQQHGKRRRSDQQHRRQNHGKSRAEVHNCAE